MPKQVQHDTQKNARQFDTAEIPPVQDGGKNIRRFGTAEIPSMQGEGESVKARERKGKAMAEVALGEILR